MSIFDRHTLSHECHFSILCANYIGSIFLWQNMAFCIKVCNPTYFAIKVHTFMAVPLSCGAIRKCKKTSLIILVCLGILKIGKNCIDNISPLERIYPHDFYLFENVQKLY